MTGPRVVVIGGGITGLAAAHHLQWGADPDGPAGAGCHVTLLEAGPRLGGKIRQVEVAGLELDVGADTFSLRAPHGLDLCRRLGLAGRVARPRPGPLLVWAGGKLRRLPVGTVMGVPAALGPLARSGALSPWGLARAAVEPAVPPSPVGGDRSVGGLVGERFGRQVVDRLVEPLLGGVYAGRADELSVEATAPPVAAAARRRGGLLIGLRGLRGAGGGLAGLEGGMGGLVEALRADLAGVEVRVGSPARGLTPACGGWRVQLDDEELPADGVVLAVPAREAGRLLAGAAPPVATELAGISHTAVAVVVLAYPDGAWERPPEVTGVLVAPGGGRMVKAVTVLGWKWPRLAGAGRVLLRCSVGRSDDRRFTGMDDAALAARIDREVRALLPLRLPPVESRVVRWPAALPRYAVGHLERVRRIRAGLRDLPPVAVAGASYDGVGVTSCARQAGDAARMVRERVAV